VTAEFDTLQEKLFTANNHSVYEIGWREIPQELGKEVAAILRAQYGIEGLEAIHQVNEFERASNNFRCKVRQGGNETTVLLRKHITKKVTAESIALVDRTLAYLREHGIAVPVLIPTIHGTTVCHVNDHFYQLFEFIDGTHYRGTYEELGDLARNLAELHIELARIPFADKISSKPTSWPAWTLDGWRELFAKAHVYDGYYDRLICGAERLILTEAAAYQSGVLDQQQPRIQVIHGDLHPLNSLPDTFAKLF
jgi:Ser/Thr protein kinase RdoA (MazF antagonist)